MIFYHGDTAKIFAAFRCVTVLAVAIFFASPLFAANVEAKKGELKDLKSRIKVLRRDVASAEKSKTYAADQLRETESAISNTSRRLHQLRAENAEARKQLARLDIQRKHLDQQTSAQQSQLAQLLNHQLASNDSEALKILLSGRDPNQSARDRYFLTQLSRAKADLLQQLRDIAAEKKALADEAKERQARLAQIESQQKEDREELLARKKQRLATLAKISERLKTQRREINALKRDEQRLTKLISGLSRRTAKSKNRPSSGSEPATMAGSSNIKSYDPGQVGGAFAALRGKLSLPVKGQVAGRFGHIREKGGATWRGLFIRAAEGAEVRAVASGAVVFSDWLRGFGNLLVIDHGDDFLSVYGNNESLLAAVGETVKSGEPIATVGNTGGNPDSGLYFELRHRGQPFDPLKWAGG
ncbi:MAG: peptidoglycan DD-metalloendopeptidase family protein [Sulfuritalea sp.]|nr:peptidoglycan DD-metalloendopeptidase family protein [Sulfuritalea sp.]